MKKYYLRFFEPEKYKENLTCSQSSESKSGTGQKDLPFTEYLRFIKGWDALVLVSDITIIAGNLGLELQVNAVFFPVSTHVNISAHQGHKYGI